MSSSADIRPARVLAVGGLLVALGAVLGLVENAIVPPLPIPGVRLGLANIAVIVAFSLLGSRRALLVSLLRVAVVGIAAGSLAGPAGLLAVSGAVCAWCATALLVARGPMFSVVGWSVAGAAGHIVGQLLAACVITGSSAPLLFTPVSLAVSLACGLTIGYAASLLLSRLSHAVSMEVVG